MVLIESIQGGISALRKDKRKGGEQAEKSNTDSLEIATMKEDSLRNIQSFHYSVKLNEQRNEFYLGKVEGETVA